MAVVPVYQRIPGKPQLPTQVDRSHPLLFNGMAEAFWINEHSKNRIVSSNGLIGTARGTVALSNKDGGAIVVSKGSDAGFDLGTPAKLNFTGEFILAGRIYLTEGSSANDYRAIVSKRDSSGYQYHFRVVSGLHLSLLTSGGSVTDNSSPLAVNKLYDVAAVRTNTTTYLFVNGSEVFSAASRSISSVPSANVFIANTELTNPDYLGLGGALMFAYFLGHVPTNFRDVVRALHLDPYAPIRRCRLLIHVTSVSGGPIVQPVGQANESDTAFAVSGLKRASVGQAAETDTAHPASILRTIHPSQAIESDAAHPATGLRAHPVSQSLETDIGQSLTVLKRLTLSQATEADTAPQVTVLGQNIVAVGLAVETDSATATGKAKTQGVSLVLESDTSWAVVPLRARVVAQAGETDAATGISVRRDVHAGLASETDSAPALTVAGQKLVPVGPATETDVAQALSSAKAMQIGLATETDAGLVVTPMRTVPLGGAAEIDAATAAGLAKAVQVGLTNETDSAFAIVIPGLTIGTKIVFTATSREINFTVTSREIKFTVLQ